MMGVLGETNHNGKPGLKRRGRSGKWEEKWKNGKSGIQTASDRIV